MKKSTLDLLENFSTINAGILIRPGNVIRTLNVARTVFGSAAVEDEFTNEFAIYDLPEFLKTISLFKDPELTFESTHVLIQGDGRSVKYHYSSPSVVVAPPDKDIPPIASPALKFVLTESMLESIIKASGVLRLKEIRFDGDCKEILVFNKDSSGNEYRIELPAEAEGEGAALVSIANLKLVPDDYEVTVGDRVVMFKAVHGNELFYMVGRETEAGDE